MPFSNVSLLAIKSKPNVFLQQTIFARFHSREKCLLASSIPSVRLSVRLSSCIRAVPIRPISVKFDIWDFYENLLCRSTFGWNRAKMSNTLHEDLSRFHCCWRHEIAIKAHSSIELVSGCYDSRRGINFARRRHGVRLYVHCESFWFHIHRNDFTKNRIFSQICYHTVY
jgi:hypothetical protein